MKRCFIALVLLFLFISAACAQGEDMVCTRDSFFPEAGNCGYDVSDYRLDMIWDVNGDSWDVIEDMTFTAEWDTDELHFDFTDAYEIYGMTIDGVAVDFTLKEEDLTIRYNFVHDTEYHLYAGFRGSLNYGLLVDEDGEDRKENSGFCMINEPTNAWRYYICNDHPKDKASYHYSFTVPAGFTPAGVGRLLEIREADGTVIHPEGTFSRDADSAGTEGMVTFSYEASDPMAPYLFTVCAFPFDLRQKTLESGVVELDFVDNTLGDLYDFAWELTDEQEAIIQLYESYLGPYPWKDLGAIVTPVRLGTALETQTRPIYDLTTLTDYIFAHELIHQWFGDLISVEDWSDIWIKEGAATFGEYLYYLHFEGPESYESDLKINYEIIAAGSSRFYEIDNTDVLRWLENGLTAGGKPEFDRGASIDAAAALCRADETGTERVDPELFGLPDGEKVTADQWMDAIKSSCKTIKINNSSLTKFYEMTGTDLGINRFVDHYAGPKEITNAFSSMYSHSVYYGGSFVYYALQERLGNELFKQGLQLLLERYRYGTVNEEKFIAVFSEIAGEDLTDFIQPWLYYGEGHVPDLPGLMTYEEARRK